MMRQRWWWLAVAAVLVVAVVSPARAEDKSADWAEKLISGEDEDTRIDAGVKLGWKDPDALALALDKVIKGKREGDAVVLATIAVRTRVIHVRYLLAWAASRFEGAGAAFREKIDNDHPMETMRAIECLGLLKDRESAETILIQLRNDDELVALQAARSLGRMPDKKLANRLVEQALSIDNKQVRIHIAWAVQDILKSQKGAMGAFAKYRKRKGTAGFRAKEGYGVLEDELAKPEAYKVKLAVIRKLFAKRGGTKTPPVDGSSESKERFEKVLEQMKKETPDYWHLASTALSGITISGNEKMFDFVAKKMNFRFRDLSGWGERDELYAYYLVRYATIVFLGGSMGEAQEGQRGWEKGIMEGYWYAMEYTKIAVDEDPVKFFASVVNMRPPPW